MAQSLLFSILLVVALLLDAVKCNIINDRPENQCASVKGQEFIRTHHEVLRSTGATFFKEARANPEMSSSLSTLVEHFSNASRFANSISCAKFLPSQEEHTANARRNIEMLGLGRTFLLTYKNDFCIKEINHSEEGKNRAEAIRVMNAIKSLEANSANVSKDVLKDYGITWNASYSTHKLEFQDPGHHFVGCDIYKTHAYYSNKTWGVYIGRTNVTPDKFVNDKERLIFGEFIGESNHLNLRWQWCENTDQVKEEIQGTGLEIFVDGPLSWSLWGENPITDNPALINAQDFINFAKEMVQDVDSAASSAILLVPAVLCLFPLSLFHDTSLWTIFAFMIVTDVVSVLPVLLRGFELVLYATRQEYSMISWIYGNIGQGRPGAAETWVASCHLKREILVWGLVFILFGFFSMITGVILEVIVVGCLNRQKQLWEEEHHQQPKEGAGLLFYLRQRKKE